jgi:hypothetical protein
MAIQIQFALDKLEAKAMVLPQEDHDPQHQLARPTSTTALKANTKD